ncbi:MAG: right-handed parallel beta-helix repeat-containing protein [Chloroflexi bacterium]|nr:right-handed parallel beta-helix repeat-containing protein [Chloroflexota bacterium]
MTVRGVANRIDISAGTVWRQFSPLLVTAIAIGLALFAGPTQVAHGATLTVDSTADTSDFSTADGVCDTTGFGGPCTLRAAIEQANFDAGTDTIEFNIAGAGPHTITPGASGLPTITDPVIIDGTSEPDFVSTPIVELDGANTGVGVDGLHIIAGNSTVKGLVINRFGGDGIELVTNGGNTIEGNFIGTDVTGTLEQGNSRGVYVNHAPFNTIGGTTSGARNVISGNEGYGVRIVGNLAIGNKIEGNYIGTDATGTLNLGNRFAGVVISGVAFNTVGGTTSGARNVISGNNKGIRITGSAATGNKVEGNYIGTDVTGTTNLGSDSFGVWIDNGASNNTIGGTTSGAGNVISGNAFSGVFIDGAPSNTIGPSNVISGNRNDGVRISGADAIGNTITGNSIHDNTGLGINNMTGGNTELTPPTVTAAGSASGSSDCASCTIEVFSDAGNEGKTFHGAATTAAGTCPCAWSFSGAVTGPNITATVTDGSGNTSEFSATQVTWGDANCSGSVNPVDSLLTLRFDAGLGTDTGDCPDFGQVVDVAFASPHAWGDVDCGGDVTPVDSLKLLRHDAGLSVAQEGNCPLIGAEVTIVD